jgi:hypothetical protein
MDGLRDEHALVEGHRREVACSAASEQDTVSSLDASAEQESDMAGNGIRIDFEVWIPEHGRDRNVTTDELLAQ